MRTVFSWAFVVPMSPVPARARLIALPSGLNPISRRFSLVYASSMYATFSVSARRASTSCLYTRRSPSLMPCSSTSTMLPMAEEAGTPKRSDMY
ncbi:Uncharacterised protein [Mycobacteroides abscessus subsp. abscessus]|nr:Uncharacterised protein [Mycobacteroides abscessus subsp. abscessus]